jgi:hypothetical protein
MDGLRRSSSIAMPMMWVPLITIRQRARSTLESPRLLHHTQLPAPDKSSHSERRWTLPAPTDIGRPECIFES